MPRTEAVVVMHMDPSTHIGWWCWPQCTAGLGAMVQVLTAAVVIRPITTCGTYVHTEHPLLEPLQSAAAELTCQPGANNIRPGPYSLADSIVWRRKRHDQIPRCTRGIKGSTQATRQHHHQHLTLPSSICTKAYCSPRAVSTCPSTAPYTPTPSLVQD